MLIVQAHNEYGAFSGEEAVVRAEARLLQGHGHEVIQYLRSSEETKLERFGGKVDAFCAGIYNPVERKRFSAALERHKPDVVHFHNLFPFLSPSVLHACKRLGVPSVMTVHGYRFSCPIGLFFTAGQVCHECETGLREWNCLLNNCTQNGFKSFGYALRGWIHRALGWIQANVDTFIALTEFQRHRMLSAGFDSKRVVVLPNMYSGDLPERCAKTDEKYIAFLGRISPEKGIDIIVDAARRIPDTEFRFAGGMGRFSLDVGVPDNCQFVGHIRNEGVGGFLNEAQFVVMASRFYEGFPMVALEAMAHSKALIGPRHGAFPEVIDEGETGLLFEPGNADDLTLAIRQLLDEPETAREMGLAGRQKLERLYSAQRHYAHLLEAYEHAILARRTCP